MRDYGKKEFVRFDRSNGNLTVGASKHRMRRYTIMTAIGLCLLLTGLICVDFVLQPQRFQAKNIDVVGDLQNIQPNQIRAVISRVSASNILRIDMARVAEAAESLPWIKDATISRKWPDTLEVRVNERVIKAKWNEGRWLDQVGFPVELPFYSNNELPQLRGPDRAAHEVLAKYQTWQRQARADGLEILEMEMSDRGSWDILVQPLYDDYQSEKDESTTSQQIQIVLGSKDSQLQIDRFFEIYREFLHPVRDQVAVIDMRYPNGLSVDWHDEPPKLADSFLISKT